ncbi:MAG: asparagine synthase C-terminal domain-containing protein, partial [Armatimonadota bacterium]|nr:asparagine synthase C-terminal domain-containing protein [Armatimonadota bacterium]
PVPFWSARDVAEAGRGSLFGGSEAEAVDELDTILRDAIRLRMVADVPLGAFLSGGIDSSAVVALMQAQSTRPVRTFSIGFHESGYNEAHHARAVAQHLGTQHTELYVSSAEAIDVIPRLPLLYDEPFADPSQIPTYLVSQLARQHVTVSLSGDGGDELFSGYNRYFWGRSLWSKMKWAPLSVRAAAARILIRLASGRWQGGLESLQQFLPARLRLPMLSDKLVKVANLLALNSPEALYLSLVSSWKNPESVVIGGREAATPLTDRSQWAELEDFTERMMYLDTVTYLPEDILAKVDRASMGVSLEARVPLLDHRVVEFAWQVPLSMKLKGGQGKHLLRQVLYRYVPKAMMERPKMGFGVPIGTWLRGPLRDWAEALLDEKRLKDEGYINPLPVRQLWLMHLSGEVNYQYHLWNILMFQTWLEQNGT